MSDRSFESIKRPQILCLSVLKQLSSLIIIKNNKTFLSRLKKFLSALKKQPQDYFQFFASRIEPRLPKRHLTDKGRMRLIGESLRSIKKLFLSFRKDIDLQSKWFQKNFWLISYQPENLTADRCNLLKELLSEYPFLNEYRQLTLAVGSLYRCPPSQLTGNKLTGLSIKEFFSQELQPALRTINKF